MPRKVHFVIIVCVGPDQLIVTKLGNSLTVNSKRGAEFQINLYGSTMPWLTLVQLLDPNGFYGNEEIVMESEQVFVG
jgi:hypothetical protein